MSELDEIFDRQQAGFERCYEALGIRDDRERSWSSLVMAINDVVRLAVKLSEPRVYAWQPIETAPKDGTQVLIYSHPDMVVAFADPDNDYAWTLDDGHDFRPCLRRHLANPTHWMPLPEAP